jgi:Family of unknown function (DUF5317)
MFILYGVAIALALGLLLGGRPSGLGDLHFRWPWVIVGALMVQVVLFSGPVSERIGDLGPYIYVASTAAVLVAVLADRAIPGMAIVAVGAACNLTAIVANGGYMPADPGARAALGAVEPTVYSNSAVIPHPALGMLTDIFAMPAGMPFANVFSVGDVIIAVGIMVVIISAMRRAPGARPDPGPTVRLDNSPERLER